MTDCLDDIQIEDVLAGQAAEWMSEHLRDCDDCRARVEQAEAIRGRLKSAFATIHAPTQVADAVRAAIRSADVPTTASRPWILRRIGVLSAAAGVVIIAGLLALMQFAQPAEARAASELVELHKANLAGAHHSQADSQAELARKLGFVPNVPDELGERRIRTCCMSQFLGRRAGNFIVEGPGEPISIIVSDANSRPLEMGRKSVRGDRTFWICTMDGFYTVAVQDGSLIYCAVGADQPDELVGVLNTILMRNPDAR